jgi:glycosyltransferase involved in cell wall biosynthesis
MRVLVAHNFYGSAAQSGEDLVYQQETELLEHRGVHVTRFERHNDRLQNAGMWQHARVGLRASWSQDTYRDLCRLLRDRRPIVAHFHNTFPLITAAAYQACRDEGVAVVQTVHNYRYACAAATFLRSGRSCAPCVEHGPLPALVNRCYRGSLAATTAVVTVQLMNRYVHRVSCLVDQFIALTEFAATKLAASGIARELISIKPNFVPGPVEAGQGEGGYALFVGRLSEEKGLGTLLAAWRILGQAAPRLLIVGDGPLRPVVDDAIREHGLNIDMLGQQPRVEILRRMRDARLLVLPSQTYEGFPLVLAEALACGTPIVASRIGSLAEIVVDGGTGAHFAAGSPSELAGVLERTWRDDVGIARMRRAARVFYERELTAERNARTLLAIYERALQPTRANWYGENQAGDGRVS